MEIQLNDPDVRIKNWLDSQGYQIIQTEDSKSKWIFGQNLLGEQLFINIITRQSEQTEINIIDTDEKLESIKKLKEKYNCEAYFAVLAPKSGKKSCYIFNLQDLLEFPWNLDRERVKALNFSSKYEQQIEIYERSENILIHNVEDLEQKIGNAASLRAEAVMINLNEYQTIFDQNITHERCKQVLVQIEAPLKPILQEFKDSLNDPSLYLHSYGVTLTTTYHDALNPKYAEQRKESNIGRKYFVQIMKKIGDSEVNALTLEFNGMEKQVLLSVETNFYPIWEAVRLNRINGIVSELNPDVDVLVSSQSRDSTIREYVERQELEDFIKSCIKPRKRPWLYFAKCFPLEGEWSVEKLFDELKAALKYLEPIRNYLQEEKEKSVQAARILTLLQLEEAMQDITLFQRMYQLQYGSVEKKRVSVDSNFL